MPCDVEDTLDASYGPFWYLTVADNSFDSFLDANNAEFTPIVQGETLRQRID